MTLEYLRLAIATASRSPRTVLEMFEEAEGIQAAALVLMLRGSERDDLRRIMAHHAPQYYNGRVPKDARKA